MISSTGQSTITALDIVLEPDSTMIQHAQTANAGLLKNFPKGYALGNEHAPHISVMGGYVYTAKLDELYAASGKVLASEKVTSWKLKAFKYYYIPLNEIGLGGIVVEPAADLYGLPDFVSALESGTMSQRSPTHLCVRKTGDRFVNLLRKTAHFYVCAILGLCARTAHLGHCLNIFVTAFCNVC